MISTRKLIYKLQQRFNKLASNEHQMIPLEDMLLVLNEAQLKLIKSKIGNNNIYKLGLDAFKKRYQDLENLIVPPETKLPVKLTDKNLSKYSADISNISPKFMFYISAYVVGSKGDCKNVLLDINNDLVKHADISTYLSSSIYQPSFEWREVVAEITNNNFNVYSDGTFTINGVNLSYLRYPQEMSIEGYVTLDNEDSQDTDCELHDYLEDELLDIAEMALGMSLDNPSAVQNAAQRQQNNE